MNGFRERVVGRVLNKQDKAARAYLDWAKRASAGLAPQQGISEGLGQQTQITGPGQIGAPKFPLNRAASPTPPPIPDIQASAYLNHVMDKIASDERSFIERRPWLTAALGTAPLGALQGAALGSQLGTGIPGILGGVAGGALVGAGTGLAGAGVGSLVGRAVHTIPGLERFSPWAAGAAGLVGGPGGALGAYGLQARRLSEGR